MEPKISLITATYNSGLTVRDTLKSVAAQTYRNIEHIIIDGASADNTLSIVGEFKHVRIVVSEKDKGIYDAMNKGIALASGEVIGIINSDDVYVGETVIDQVMKLFLRSQADAVYGDLQYVDKKNPSRVTRNWKAGKFSRAAFYYGWMPPHPALFVRKNVYSRVGTFNTLLKTSADYEFMIRLFLKNSFRIEYMPQVLVKMRAGGISNASFSNRLRANREDHQAWKMNGLRPGFLTRYLKPIRKIFQFRP